MSRVFNRTDGRFLFAVHIPDYSSADWILNPDLTEVVKEPSKYWVIDPPGSDTIRVATASEKAAVDAAIGATQLDAEKATAKSQVDAKYERLLRALVELLLGEFNTLRAQHGLPARTLAQVRAALKANIDAQTS